MALLCINMLALTIAGDVRWLNWPLEISGFPAFRDFANLWAGGIAAANGEFGRLASSAEHSRHLGEVLGVTPPAAYWSYPPTAMLLLQPLSALPYAPAAALWTVAGIVAAILASGVLRSSRGDGLVRLMAIALSPGVFLCVAYGQTALLTSAALIGGMSLAKRRPLLAGALLSLLAIKPQMAIVVPVALIALGAWWTVLTTAFFTAAFLLATVTTFGLAPWHLFLESTMPQQVAILHDGIVNNAMLISPFALARALGADITAAYALHGAVAAIALALLGLGLTREKNFDLRVLMIAATALLLSPYTQTYELPLLVLAAARVFGHSCAARELGLPSIWAIAASVTLLPFMTLAVLDANAFNLTCLIPLGLLAALALRQKPEAKFLDGLAAKIALPRTEYPAR